MSECHAVLVLLWFRCRSSTSIATFATSIVVTNTTTVAVQLFPSLLRSLLHSLLVCFLACCLAIVGTTTASSSLSPREQICPSVVCSIVHLSVCGFIHVSQEHQTKHLTMTNIQHFRIRTGDVSTERHLFAFTRVERYCDASTADVGYNIHVNMT